MYSTGQAESRDNFGLGPCWAPILEPVVEFAVAVVSELVAAVDQEMRRSLVNFCLRVMLVVYRSSSLTVL